METGPTEDGLFSLWKNSCWTCLTRRQIPRCRQTKGGWPRGGLWSTAGLHGPQQHQGSQQKRPPAGPRSRNGAEDADPTFHGWKHQPALDDELGHDGNVQVSYKRRRTREEASPGTKRNPEPGPAPHRCCA